MEQVSIRDAINKIIEKRLPLMSIPAKVTAVDESKGVCDVEPLDGTAEIFDVLINAEQTDDAGIVAVPAVDSVVYVTFVSKDVAFISLSSVIDKVFIKINNISLEIDKDAAVFNGGNNDGIVKIGDLIGKLNTIENDLNSLKAAFSSWVVVPADGGAALKTIAASWYGQTITPTLQTELEDTKVKH